MVINLPIRAEDISRVVAIEDPILRNLWITQSYADFAARLRAALDAEDSTWCGFAVWASATAGQSIRREELPGILSKLLQAGDQHQGLIDEINRRLRPLRALHLVPRLGHVHLVRAFDDALDAVSAHIAHGNTLVYAELAPLFVAFIEAIEADGTAPLTSAELTDLLDRTVDGTVDPDVGAAFEWYRQAVVSADRRERPQAMLAANVMAVAHEQRRLQDDIAAALDSGVLTAEQVVAELLPRWAPRFVARVIGRAAAGPIQRVLDELWDDVVTELLMTMRVPGATLRLHDDVPPGPGGRLFPPDLAELAHGLASAAYAQWDRTDGTGRPCGARDWAVLGERMSYIVNLFRSRQQDQSLSVPPFAADQIEAMQAGRVPSGPLLPL